MKTQAKAVVIGGGVVGASVLYHLTRNGWTDVVLVERRELTAGSTWHAAGGMHTLNGDPNVAALQKYTIELYREIEEISGQDCGIHLTGGVQLADTEERMDWLRNAHARGRYLGVDTEMISVAEAKELLPYLDEQYFVGAMYDPLEGHVDPSGVTNAYAKAARMAGAEVERHTWAQDIRRRPDGLWDIDCGEAGTITCEHFVNAGGLWARDVGRMCGLELPVLAMEHMYLLTESVPGIRDWNRASGRQGLHAVDFGGEIYLRQEGESLLLGTYERHGVPWSVYETPWDFEARLLEPDLDRIADSLAVGFAHFPIFNELGIKQVINGPFTFTPDGNPVIGPIRDQPGHWVAAGVMAGLSQGGGVGMTLANWMTDGDPGHDVWAMDVARYGPWATPRYTEAKVRENYGRRFRIAYPNEELPAGRPLQTTPIHDRLTGANAVWGASYGLEHALWYQQPGLDPVEEVTLRRSNAFDRVAGEVAAVRSEVGLLETTNFAKYEVAGPGARAWLDHLLTNTMPSPGRLVLSPMLNPTGRIIGDFTVGCLADGLAGQRDGGDDAESFVIFGSGAAEAYHRRWFAAQLPADGSVTIRAFGPDLCGLAIAGPAARSLLAAVADADVSAEAFRFLDIRSIELGHHRCLVGRISFTGDLGYELWMPSAHQRAVFDLLVASGADHGLRLFGGRALDSLRLEKNFGAWATEYRPIYTPDQAGLGWTVRTAKDFVGRDAVVAEREGHIERRLAFFTLAAEIDPVGGASDAIGDEPIWFGDEVVGWVTSGGYAHHSQASVAAGYVRRDVAAVGDGYEIEVFGVRRRASRLTEPLFDPAGDRMRG
ncbi:MAG: FAD-dependent oxidoreductase [Actinomycetota bacterium]